MSVVEWTDGDPTLVTARWTLPCGLDVIVHPDPSSPLVAVSVWYRVGASDEALGTSGFAHLYEHLFKNSLHLGGRHHYDVLREGGAVDANASTSADRTAYHEVVPATQLELALWIESDRMGWFLPGLTAARLATQKAVVRNERRQRYENVAHGPERFALAAALYPEGHPYRYLTIGRHEDIEAATLEQVADFYRTWYVPANATLVLSGGVDVDTARAMVDKWFGGFPPSTRPARPMRSAPPLPGRIEVAVDDRFTALRRLRWAWPSPVIDALDDHCLDVVAAILTPPGTGRLWRALIYQRPLAQRVQSWQHSTRLGGEFHVAVDLRTGADADEVRDIVAVELARLISEGPEERELGRVRTRREAAVLWQLEGVQRRATMLQREALYGTGGLAQELARVRAITADDVRAAAIRWLRADSVVEVATHALRAPGAEDGVVQEVLSG